MPRQCPLRQAELTALKKQVGLFVNTDHLQFQAVPAGPDAKPASRGLLLSEYFEWAEVRIILAVPSRIGCRIACRVACLLVVDFVGSCSLFAISPSALAGITGFVQFFMEAQASHAFSPHDSSKTPI